MGPQTKDLSEKAAYQGCVALVRGADFKHSGADFTALSQKLESYGPGLSAWFEVYRSANPFPSRPGAAAALMRVVNALLAKWSSGERASETLQGFEYHSERTCFSIQQEDWEGLDEDFRRDFHGAKQLLK